LDDNNDEKIKTTIKNYQEWELKFIQNKRKTGKYDINCTKCFKGVRSDGVAGDVNSAGFRERQFKCPCGYFNGRLEAIFRKKNYETEADIIAKELQKVKNTVLNFKTVVKITGVKSAERQVKKRGRLADSDGEEPSCEEQLKETTNEKLANTEPNAAENSIVMPDRETEDPIIVENRRLKKLLEQQAENMKQQAIELKRLSETVERLTKALGKTSSELRPYKQSHEENTASIARGNTQTTPNPKTPDTSHQDSVPQSQFDRLFEYIQNLERKIDSKIEPKPNNSSNNQSLQNENEFPALPRSYAEILKTKAQKQRMPAFKREKQERLLLSLATPRQGPAKHSKFWIKVENQRLLNSCKSMKEKIYVIRKLFRKLGVNRLILTFSVIGNAIIEIYCKEENEVQIQERMVDYGIRPVDYDPNTLPSFMLPKEALCKAADRISRLHRFCKSIDMKNTVLRGVSGKLLEIVMDRIEVEELKVRKRHAEIEKKKMEHRATLYGDNADVHYQSAWLDFKTRIEQEGVNITESEITAEIRNEVRVLWGRIDRSNVNELAQTKQRILESHPKAFQKDETDMMDIIEQNTDGDAQQRL
jgi:hypothetical protein